MCSKMNKSLLGGRLGLHCRLPPYCTCADHRGPALAGGEGCLRFGKPRIFCSRFSDRWRCTECASVWKLIPPTWCSSLKGDHTPGSLCCCSPFSVHATLSLWECSSTSLLQTGQKTSFSFMSLCLWAQAVMPSSECSFRVLPQIAHSGAGLSVGSRLPT
jgi:hypothetical protein